MFWFGISFILVQIRHLCSFINAFCPENIWENVVLLGEICTSQALDTSTAAVPSSVSVSESSEKPSETTVSGTSNTEYFSTSRTDIASTTIDSTVGLVGTTFDYSTSATTSAELASTSRGSVSESTILEGTESTINVSAGFSSESMQTMGMLPSCYIPTTGGNSAGAICVLPFQYKNTLYYMCTTVDRGVLWCSTTANFDQDDMWGICGGKSISL